MSDDFGFNFSRKFFDGITEERRLKINEWMNSLLPDEQDMVLELMNYKANEREFLVTGH